MAELLDHDPYSACAITEPTTANPLVSATILTRPTSTADRPITMSAVGASDSLIDGYLKAAIWWEAVDPGS